MDRTKYGMETIGEENFDIIVSKLWYSTSILRIISAPILSRQISLKGFIDGEQLKKMRMRELKED